MKPTIAVMSYRKLTSLIEKIYPKFPDAVQINVIDAVLDDALKIAKKIEENEEADVFVSAGGNYRLLSQHLKSPFVEIEVTGFDILLALKKAKKYSDRIGIVTYEDKIQYLDEVSEMLTVWIKEVTYSQLEHVEGVLEQLLNEGINTVVGASLVLESAQRKGMHGVLIYSPDGVIRALNTAVKIALSKKSESEKAERFRIILDFAYGGIVAADKKGNITVFNPSAEKITGIPRQKAIGRPADLVLPNTRLNEVIRTGKPQLNQLQSLGNIKILTNRVPIVVNNEITGVVATFQDVNTIQDAEEKIRQKLYQKGLVAKASLEDILGRSEQINRAKRKAYLYAQSDSTVLITGESGTGKELFAQGIHNASARAKRPFVAINCAALPENLLESELFGYEEGAFTGARKGGKQGFFELAHGGTIFLDEIGEITPKLQSRLLRVLEEHEVMRIGGDRLIPVNIRVIAATNKNLWQMVKQGKFREDLYYRINVLELHIPSLRERKEDIPLLVAKFLAELREDLEKNEVLEISRHPLFVSYDWPGNVRELRNIVERFAVLFTGDIEKTSLLRSLFGEQTDKKVFADEFEEIAQVLREVRGNKSEAARRLGISRTSLWRKLKKTKLL